MLSESWLLLILISLLLGAALQLDGLILMGVLMGVASTFGWVWNRLALHRVEYAREFPVSRAFVGERVPVSFSVTNRKVLPVPWLNVVDTLPETLNLIDRPLQPSGSTGRVQLTHLASLGPYERVRWTYEVDCTQRGFYFFGPADLHSGDVFGFFARRRRLRTPDRLIVYPQVRPLPELGFPDKEPFGERRSRQTVIEDPVRTIGVREYHPEDSIKRVHWKASARHGDLQVKVYEPVITRQLVVFLNVASFAQTWRGIIPQRQEQAISVAASIVYHTIERRYAVGLIANGSVPHSDQSIRVYPSRAPGQLIRLLEALAAVTAFATGDIEKLLVAESPRLPLGATLTVVTTVVTEGLLAVMVRLRDAGRRLALVSLDPEYVAQGTPVVTTYHIPLTEADFAGVWTRPTVGEALAVPAARAWGRHSGRGG
jgi:uncharacterized protein (DUF58 family)